MRLPRRDLLRGLAGAAGMAGAGMAACARARRPGLTGSIVGGAHARGHRVRDGFLPRPESWQDVTVAVLGGGVAGASPAWGPWRPGAPALRVVEQGEVP